MNLPSGSRLGPYEIIELLGAGGMGEVYRARDSRLGRDVAVKVLSEHLSDRPEARARFEREAKTVSSLNHPHICTLFDVGCEGDTDYLVMELVEGETLADCVGRGPLPVPEVLKLGAQIADALDRAHRAGVVHRDIKPANVMLTKGGAKLMDFGLARAVGPAGPAGQPAMETITQGTLTEEGTILGTFFYMAPEQLEGGDSDARSDIWALGCVLHEMATGKRPFGGGSRASLIASIMKEEPRPLAELVPVSPPALDRVVRQCLAKDRDDRWQTAGDLRRELEWIADPASSATGVGAPTPQRPRRRSTAPWAWGVAGVLAVLFALQFLRGGETVPRRTTLPERYVVAKAELTGLSKPALSPDGGSLVFSAHEGPTRQIYRRDLSSFESSPIPGTEGGKAPFFSPDGAWVGFVTDDGIRKVPAAGGPSQVIHAEQQVMMATWGPNGNIYYTLANGGGDRKTALMRVPATGGPSEVFAVMDQAVGEGLSFSPQVLPDGKTVLLTIYGQDPLWQVVALRPGGERHLVAADAINGHYVPSGHLIYMGESQAVLAAPFDVAEARITGPAIPLTEPVDLMYAYAASSDRVAYVPVAGEGQGDEVVWLERSGVATVAIDMTADWTQPRLSPDGTRLLLRKVGAPCELWMLDIESGSLVEVAHGRDNEEAIWSPDGRRIAYFESDSPQRMLTRKVSGQLGVETLMSGPGSGEPQSWSREGNLLVYSTRDARTNSDIWVLPMDRDAEPVRFLATEADELAPCIAPNGRWIAYSSNESGTPEVYVRRYPDTGEVWQVSASGGIAPLWSHDGRRLFYIVGTRLMEVPVEVDPTLELGTAAQVFEGGFSISRLRNYDLAPDGRFVVVRRVGGDAGLSELRMLVNWQEEMRRIEGGSE